MFCGAAAQMSRRGSIQISLLMLCWDSQKHAIVMISVFSLLINLNHCCNIWLRVYSNKAFHRIFVTIAADFHIFAQCFPGTIFLHSGSVFGESVSVTHAEKNANCTMVTTWNIYVSVCGVPHVELMAFV